MSTPPIIVVCGLRQSSVGQIAALLASHPQAVLLPELNVFMAEQVGALQLLFERSHDGLGDGLLRAVAVLQSGRDDAAGIQQARDWLWRRQDRSSLSLLTEMAQRVAPRQLILPDRMLGWRPNYRSRLLALEPFRLIHVVRHPVLHAADIARQLNTEAFIAPEWRDFCGDPAGVLDPQIGWYRFHTSLVQVLQQDARYQRIRLEDLQSHPQAVLQQLAGFLGWSQSPQLGRLPDSAFLRAGCEAAPLGMEKSALLHPRLMLDLRPANPPLNEPVSWREDGRLLCQEVQQLARQFGYGPTA